MIQITDADRHAMRNLNKNKELRQGIPAWKLRRFMETHWKDKFGEELTERMIYGARTGSWPEIREKFEQFGPEIMALLNDRPPRGPKFTTAKERAEQGIPCKPFIKNKRGDGPTDERILHAWGRSLIGKPFDPPQNRVDLRVIRDDRSETIGTIVEGYELGPFRKGINLKLEGIPNVVYLKYYPEIGFAEAANDEVETT